MCYYPKVESLGMPMAQAFFCGEGGSFPASTFQFCRVQSIVRLDLPTWKDAKHYWDHTYETDLNPLSKEIFANEIDSLRRRQKKIKRQLSALLTTGTARTATGPETRRKRFGGHFMILDETPSPPPGKKPRGQLENAPGITTINLSYTIKLPIFDYIINRLADIFEAGTLIPVL